MSQISSSASSSGPGSITSVVTDSGTAAPTAGVLNVIADIVQNHCGSSVEFTGSGNTVLLNVTDANNNTIMGEGSGAFSGGGNTYNVVFGYNSFLNASNSLGNICIGHAVLSANPSANNIYNIGIGSNAFGFLSGGSNNIGIGSGAGEDYSSTESSNILLNAASTCVPGENNTLRIGDGTGAGTQQLAQTFISGIDGVNLSSANIVTEVANQLGTATLTAGAGISIDAVSTPNQIILAAVGDITSVATDSGTATPSAGVLNIITNQITMNCGSSVEFTGSGNTVELNVTDGFSNTLMGEGCGNNAYAGSGSNTGLGESALSMISSASFNTAMGNSALQNINIASGSTAVGFECLSADNAGTNTAMGYLAAQNLILADNVAIGAGALQQAANANQNVVIGSSAGSNLLGSVTASNNIIIGYSAGAGLSGDESNNIMLGNFGVAGDANVIRIGNQGSGTGDQNTCYIAGITGVTTANSQLVTINTSTGQLGSQAPTGLTTTWSTITANQTAAVSNGYFINKAGTLALLLPAVSAVGDVIEVANINTATGTQITQAAGQQIFIGNTSTTSGAGGSLTSTALGDTLRLVCSTANTTWVVVNGLIGNWTVV